VSSASVQSLDALLTCSCRAAGWDVVGEEKVITFQEWTGEDHKKCIEIAPKAEEPMQQADANEASEQKEGAQQSMGSSESAQKSSGPEPDTTLGQQEEKGQEKDEHTTTRLDERGLTDGSPDKAGAGRRGEARGIHRHGGEVASEAPISNDPTGETNGESRAALTTVDGKLVAHSVDGNVYFLTAPRSSDAVRSPADPASLFRAVSTVPDGINDHAIPTVVSDYEQKVLHTFPSEVERFGFGRLRVHHSHEISGGSVPVSVQTLERPDKATARSGDLSAGEIANVRQHSPEESWRKVALLDSAHRAYCPVLCVYKHNFPKLFLAGSGQHRAQQLANLPGLTGPGVKECSFVELTIA
jgi:hypothetical protein